MRLAGTISDSIVDGPGIRYVIFFQGCSHKCKGCQNPHTHDFNGGYYISTDDLLQTIPTNSMLSGVTLSGGDPLDQLEDCADLVVRLKKQNINIWLYTGYTYEELIAKKDSQIDIILRNIDVLVEGPFIVSQRSWDLNYKGSKNQRIIDMPETILQNHIVLYST